MASESILTSTYGGMGKEGVNSNIVVWHSAVKRVKPCPLLSRAEDAEHSVVLLPLESEAVGGTHIKSRIEATRDWEGKGREDWAAVATRLP